jgi:hypothetical protein
MFKPDLGKSKIEFDSKCHDCGCTLRISIYPTFEGFGLKIEPHSNSVPETSSLDDLLSETIRQS